MAQLTNAAIQGYKQYTIDNVVAGRYRVGNTYYPLTILSKEILPNGKMLIRPRGISSLRKSSFTTGRGSFGIPTR